MRRTDLVPEDRTQGISVKAADTQLLTTLGGTMAAGEWLDNTRSGLPVVVLGSVTAQRLGITDVGAGVRVWLGEQWFTVIGILAPLELAADIDRAVLIGRDIAQDRSAARLSTASTPSRLSHCWAPSQLGAPSKTGSPRAQTSASLRRISRLRRRTHRGRGVHLGHGRSGRGVGGRDRTVRLPG